MAERLYRILVCRGPECGDRRGSRAVYDAFRRALDQHGLAARCELGWQSCFGRCTQGPNVLVREITPPGAGDGATPPVAATALYNGVAAVNADLVVQDHVGRGEPVRALIVPPTLRILDPSGSSAP